LAQGLIDYCEYDYARLSALFGVTVPTSCLPIAVDIVPWAQGLPAAQNNGPGTVPALQPPTITVFVQDAIEYPWTISPDVVAETAEIFMVVQKRWNPVWSSGEALSRVCVQILYPPAAPLASTGSDWFSPATHLNPPNWIDNVVTNDHDMVSVGCASLFLNYLAYQLDYTWPAIIAAGPKQSGTLAETAGILGVGGNVFNDFLSLLQTNFPSGSLPPSSPYPFPKDDVFPLGPPPAQLPALYIRHNTADDGTSHAPPLTDSPDIIYKNTAVADPQATYSTAASIASANESDPTILTGQTHYLYLRVWNRGVAEAQNVFATVYWSPPATLVTPSMWTWLGVGYFPQVPAGSTVEVTTVGIPWPADDIPPAGHYCYVATVGSNYQPAPDPNTLAAFATFQDYVDYIAANNDIAWHNFNVVTVPPGQIKGPFGDLIGLPFLIAGAWTGEEEFIFETVARLPEKSVLALQVPDWIGRGMVAAREDAGVFYDTPTGPANTRRVRIPLPANEARSLRPVRLPAHTAAPSHLLVGIDLKHHHEPHEVSVRQLYKGQEVGRITWRLVPGNRRE
jgi:hypothetical protein